MYKRGIFSFMQVLVDYFCRDNPDNSEEYLFLILKKCTLK
jgi:hypothetical protein